MLTKRLIACFDVKNGRVTKARQFQDNLDVAAAEDMARIVYEEQIDEIIFYDIMASPEKRGPDLNMVRRVAERVFVPFTVGGGVKTLDDMYATLRAGAEKISVDSAAVRDPDILRQGARAFGSQCVVLSMQVRRVGVSPKLPSGYEIMLDGARVAAGLDAVAWARRGESLGAGEICVNSIDNDGTHSGYDLEITAAVAGAVNLPVIASGGAGTPAHLAEAFAVDGVSAAVISSMLYSPRLPKNFTVREIKEELSRRGVPVRPWTPPVSP
jgi:cyclase